MSYVAQIGNTYYDTLQKAIGAVNDGTITLLSDIDLEGESIDIANKTITLDMAGKTISSTGIELFRVDANGDLTITGNGTINGPTNGEDFDGKSLICVDGGKLTIENGTLTATGRGADGMYGVYALNGATAIFGTEDGEGPTIASWFAPIGTNNTTSPATITVNGGTYTENARPTNNEWWSYFCAPIYAASAGTYTINGGTFNGYYGISSRYSNVDQSITINGGTFNSAARDLFLDTQTGIASEATRTNPVIKGGTFSFNPKSVKIGTATEGVSLVDPGSTVSPSGTKFVVANAATAAAKIVDKYYPTLDAAVAAVENDQTITLLSDVTEGVTINNGKTFTIDLNDKTLKGSKAGFEYNASANIALKNANLTITNGKIGYSYWGIQVYGSPVKNGENAYTNSLTLTNTATLENCDYGLVMQGQSYGADQGWNSTVTLNGNLINSLVFVSGNMTSGDMTLNCTGTINSHDDVAIALNGFATVNVSEDAVIYAKHSENNNGVGIEVRAGNLNVSGGKITGTGVPTTVTPNGSGTTSTGAGIAVAQHTTKLPIKVTISGGEINGYSAFYESNPQNNNTEDLNKITLTITGGTFNTTEGGTVAVYSKDKAGFITGGYFSSDPGAYVAADKVAKRITDTNDAHVGYYTIFERNTTGVSGSESATSDTTVIAATATSKEGSTPAAVSYEVVIKKDGNAAGSVDVSTTMTPADISAGSEKLVNVDDEFMAQVVASAVAIAKAKDTSTESFTDTEANNAVDAVKAAVKNFTDVVGVVDSTPPRASDVDAYGTGVSAQTQAEMKGYIEAASGENKKLYKIDPYAIIKESDATDAKTLAFVKTTNAKINTTKQYLITLPDSYTPHANVDLKHFAEDGKVEAFTVQADDSGTVSFYVNHFSYVGATVNNGTAVAKIVDGGNTYYYYTIAAAVADAQADTADAAGTVILLAPDTTGEPAKLSAGQYVKVMYSYGDGDDAFHHPEYAAIEGMNGTILEATNDDGSVYTFFAPQSTQVTYTVETAGATVGGTDAYLKDSYAEAQTVKVPVKIKGGTFYGATFTFTYDPNIATNVSFAPSAAGLTMQNTAFSESTDGKQAAYQFTVVSSTPLAADTKIGDLTFTVQANQTFTGHAYETIGISAKVNPDYNHVVTVDAAAADVVIPVAYLLTITPDVKEAGYVTFTDGTNTYDTPNANNNNSVSGYIPAVVNTGDDAKTVPYVMPTVTMTRNTTANYVFKDYMDQTDGDDYVFGTQTSTENSFTMAMRPVSILAEHYTIVNVTVIGSYEGTSAGTYDDVTRTVYQVRSGFTLGDTDAIYVSPTQNDTLTAAKLTELVGTSKYTLRNWTVNDSEKPISTSTLLTTRIDGDTVIKANTAKFFKVTQSSTKQDVLQKQVETTGEVNAYSDTDYKITLKDANAGGSYDPKYTYTVTVNVTGDDTIASVPAADNGNGTYTIAKSALASLDAGASLTVTVTKSLTDLVVNAYPYSNNIVLITAKSATNAVLKYKVDGASAIFTDSRFGTTGGNTYVMLIDVAAANLTGKTMAYIANAVKENIGYKDDGSTATDLQDNYSAAGVFDVNLQGAVTGNDKGADIADITLVYNAYKGTYSYLPDANGVLKYHDVQYYLSDVTFSANGQLDGITANSDSVTPPTREGASQLVNLDDVKAEYDVAYPAPSSGD